MYFSLCISLLCSFFHQFNFLFSLTSFFCRLSLSLPLFSLFWCLLAWRPTRIITLQVINPLSLTSKTMTLILITPPIIVPHTTAYLPRHATITVAMPSTVHTPIPIMITTIALILVSLNLHTIIVPLARRLAPARHPARRPITVGLAHSRQSRIVLGPGLVLGLGLGRGLGQGLGRGQDLDLGLAQGLAQGLDPSGLGLGLGPGPGHGLVPVLGQGLGQGRPIGHGHGLGPGRLPRIAALPHLHHVLGLRTTTRSTGIVTMMIQTLMVLLLAQAVSNLQQHSPNHTRNQRTFMSATRLLSIIITTLRTEGTTSVAAPVAV